MHLAGSRMYTSGKILMGEIKTTQAEHFGTDIRGSLQEGKCVPANMKESPVWQTLGVDKNDPKSK